MQSLLQLNPSIPLMTPKGEGLAVMVIDYGPDFDLWWTVIIGKGPHAGEIWTYSNPQVRGVQNITLGRETGSAAHGLHRPSRHQASESDGEHGNTDAPLPDHNGNNHTLPRASLNS